MLNDDQIYLKNRVVRGDGLHGVIVAIRKRRPTMVEVRWFGLENTTWNHPEQLSVPCALPPPVVKAPLGSRYATSPSYLRELREQAKRRDDQHQIERQRVRMDAQLADDLARLGPSRKTKTKNKAKKLIANFDKGIMPKHTITWSRYEARQLGNRIDRDR